jgi:rod shape-determining protein MreD
MNEFSDRLLTEVPRKNRIFRFRPAAIFLVPLGAILLQVYLPRLLPSVTSLSYLELPLLVTVYFSLMRRQPVAGVFFGALIGLAQDSLSNQPLGMFGIVKTLVGYFAASVSMRFDVDNPFIQFVLGFFFYCFHQFFYWVLARALLGQPVDFNPQQTLIFALLNSLVGLPLFMLLDKIKE